MNNKIKLKFKGVSSIVGTEELGLIIMTNEDESRQITIVCDKLTEQQFILRLKDAPVKDRLLPEVLVGVLNDAEIRLEILINNVIDGEYQTMLFNPDTLYTIKMRASDAMLLSLIGNIPVYIAKDLMFRQSSPFKQGERGMTIPVNAINQTMLESALEKAIKDENYELASKIRDELKKREKNKPYNDTNKQ